MVRMIALFGVFGILASCSPDNMDAQEQTDALIQEALSAGMPAITDAATVMDSEGNVLREGSNGWICMPTPPQFPPGSTPMCLDDTFMKWAQAWMTQGPVEIDKVGISYMLKGDAGASNTDPFAMEKTADNNWVESGPHLMIVAPNPSALDGISDDPDNGGPFVMWRGTPYAHIMVPVP